MTTEQALKRLAIDCFDQTALESLYLENRLEIDKAITQWFGHSTVVYGAARRVLARIATSAAQFNPRTVAAEVFIAELVDEECKHVLDEERRRVHDAVWQESHHH